MVSVHIVHVVLCTCGIVYTWYNVVVYIWHCVHIVQVAPCTCDFVHTLCRWLFVEVVICTCCTYSTGVHVVLCACHTCYVAGMWYYVCAFCSHGIVSCVFVMLYSVYIYLLCEVVHRV